MLPHRSLAFLTPAGSLLTLLLFFLPAACSPAVSDTVTTLIRDSAGVTVVENVGTVNPPDATWLVTEEPDLVLGGPGFTPVLFNVTGGIVLPSGNVAVSSRGSGEIIMFDANGRFLISHGRRGEGPGEYDWPVVTGVLGMDTLVVVDSGNRRISLVHAEGGFLTSSRIKDELGPTVSPRGMFSDGTVMVGGGYSWDSRSGDQATSGYSRPTTTYRSASLDGSLMTDFGEFPGAEFNITVTRLPGGESSMSADLMPFAKHPSVAVGSDLFFVGTRDSWEIRAFDLEGDLAKILRMDRAPSPVEDADMESLIQRDLDAAQDPSAEQAIRRRYAEMPWPETMPAYSRILVDELGFLWVERYRRPGDDQAVFDVLDPEGALTAQVNLPKGNRILSAGAQYVLTLHRDELDVESVRLFQLTRH